MSDTQEDVFFVPEERVAKLAEDFIDEVRWMMHEKMMSQKKLAERMKVSEGRVSQILSNPGNMRLNTLMRIADGLGLHIRIYLSPFEDREDCVKKMGLDRKD